MIERDLNYLRPSCSFYTNNFQCIFLKTYYSHEQGWFLFQLKMICNRNKSSLWYFPEGSFNFLVPKHVSSGDDQLLYLLGTRMTVKTTITLVTFHRSCSNKVSSFRAYLNWYTVMPKYRSIAVCWLSVLGWQWKKKVMCFTFRW